MGLNQSRSCQSTLQPQQHQIQASSATYTHSPWQRQILNPLSKPGIKPASSWILVSPPELQQELQNRQISLFFYFLLFRAAPVVYRNSQARGWIEATAADLCHSHRNMGSELHLQTLPQLTVMPDPQPTWRGQGSNLHPHGSQLGSLTLNHEGNSLK